MFGPLPARDEDPVETMFGQLDGEGAADAVACPSNESAGAETALQGTVPCLVCWSFWSPFHCGSGARSVGFTRPRGGSAKLCVEHRTSGPRPASAVKASRRTSAG